MTIIDYLRDALPILSSGSAPSPEREISILTDLSRVTARKAIQTSVAPRHPNKGTQTT